MWSADVRMMMMMLTDFITKSGLCWSLTQLTAKCFESFTRTTSWDDIWITMNTSHQLLSLYIILTFTSIGCLSKRLSKYHALESPQNSSCLASVGDAMLDCREYMYRRQNVTDVRCCFFSQFKKCLQDKSKDKCGLATEYVVHHTLMDYYPSNMESCVGYGPDSFTCIIDLFLLTYGNCVWALLLLCFLYCKCCAEWILTKVIFLSQAFIKVPVMNIVTTIRRVEYKTI